MVITPKKPIWQTPLAILLIISGIVISIFVIHPRGKFLNAKMIENRNLFEQIQKEKDSIKRFKMNKDSEKLQKTIDEIWIWPFIWLVIFMFIIGIIMIFK